MHTMEYICVFASSSARLTDAQYAYAKALGEEIAKSGYGLVFGGGRLGLMGAVADGALAHGGPVIGVIPEHLHKPGIAHPGCHELVVTPTMHVRKETMENRCAAFIALPGGFGTLEELLEVITLRQLGYHEKPIILCNQDGYFDALLQQFEAGFSGGFADEAYRALYCTANTPKEALQLIAKGENPDLPDKMKDSRVIV